MKKLSLIIAFTLFFIPMQSFAASGDLNSDGKVDVTDLGILLSNWGVSGSADINNDGVVDVVDLGILLSNWGSGAPPPSSNGPIIDSITWNSSTFKHDAPGSDNWPMTWANDGNLYTSWGDGGGFGGTNSDGRVSLGVARVEGSAALFKGFNIWGGKNAPNKATFGGKSYGIISIGGNLYMWVSPGSSAQGYAEARLYKSTNKGASWQKANWAFTQSQSIIFPSILQFGKDYQGARDNFVYIYSTRLKNASIFAMQRPGEVDLFRVPKNALMDRGKYEFFKGLDKNGNPIWTTDINKKEPVFKQVNVGWAGPSVSYNPALKRYILVTDYHAGSGSLPISGDGLALYEASNPWGPWAEIVKYDSWIHKPVFFYNIPTKWISSDGKTFYMVFTGTGRPFYDSFNIIKGTLKLKSEVTPP